jgi:hypothetical protein
MRAQVTSLLQRAGRALDVAGDRLLTLLLVRKPARSHCPDCVVDFAPALTDQRCPICGWVVPDVAIRPAAMRHRTLAGIGTAWFLGAVVFALLAHALYS